MSKFTIGCPDQYRLPFEYSANVCLENSCPIPTDMKLEECMKSCNEMKQCYLFNHVNVDNYSKCYLYGYEEEQGTISDSPCKDKVGNTCCEKSKRKTN